jgi:putative flippase GtrA
MHNASSVAGRDRRPEPDARNLTQRRALITRLFRFAVGGVVGFIVDSSLLYAFMAAGLGPYVARVPSFLCAATCTWLVNRYWTFADRRTTQRSVEWGRYIVAMIVGGGFNYAAYATLLSVSATARAWPVLGVAAGSIAGMGVNYLSSHYWVFRDRSQA